MASGLLGSSLFPQSETTRISSSFLRSGRQNSCSPLNPDMKTAPACRVNFCLSDFVPVESREKDVKDVKSVWFGYLEPSGCR